MTGFVYIVVDLYRFVRCRALRFRLRGLPVGIPIVPARDSNKNTKEEGTQNKPTRWNSTRVPHSPLKRIGSSTSIRRTRARFLPGIGRVAWMATVSTSGIMINPISRRDLEWADAQFPGRLVVLRIVSDKLMLYPQHVVILPCCRKQLEGRKCLLLPTWITGTQALRFRTLPCHDSRELPSCNRTLLKISRNRRTIHKCSSIRSSTSNTRSSSRTSKR